MTTPSGDSSSRRALAGQPPHAGATAAFVILLRLTYLLPFGILAAVATITSVNKASWDDAWATVMLVGIVTAYSAAFAALTLLLRRN
ncbi:hypothetical protein [Arthrobacter sp.]|uniref:hypothetical protein n=1 Tax=Arthrobacter sp. TaxID=1667 RepID=UPI0028124724|nr:hypothetical protein [Arthrobacter sp.]